MSCRLRHRAIRHNPAFCTRAATSAIAVASACLGTAPIVRAIDGTWIGGDSYATAALRFAPNGGPAELPDPVVFWSETRNWSNGWTFPGDGGTATIGMPLPTGDVDRLAQVKVLMDVSTSLGALRLDNPRGVALLDTFPSFGAFIWAVPGGFTVESLRGRPEPASRAASVLSGNSIQIPIFGPNDVTVRGPGVLSLTRSNGFSGDLRLVGDSGGGGILAITEQVGSELDNSRFGVGQRIAMQGGTLRLQRGSGSTPRVLSRPIYVDSAGGTIALHGGAAGIAWEAPVSGAGTLRLERGRRELRDDNPITGAVRIDAPAALAVTGRLAAAGSILVSGTLELNHALTLVDSNRISDSAEVLLHGGALTLGGGSIATYAETIGRVQTASGVSTVSIVPPAGATTTTPPVTLRVNEFLREPGSGAMFRGDGLGGNGAAPPRILLANGSSLLVGGGDQPGTPRQSIIPWAWGVSGPAVTSLTGAGSGSFVTHDPATGIRPLNLATEYAPVIAAAAAADNVRVSSHQSLGGAGRQINALLLASVDGTPGGAPPSLLGGTISIASGAILNTAVGSTVFNPIDFADREGVILAASTPQSATGSNRGVAFWGAIAGSGGLTRLGHGNVFLGGANTYTGPTFLSGGRTTIVDDVLPNVPGPFGQSDDPITLLAGGVSAGGTVATMLLNERVGDPLVIARPIRVDGMTSAAAGMGSTNLGGGVLVGGVVNGSAMRFTGPVQLLARDVTLGAFAGGVQFEGEISGPGGLRVLGGAGVTLTRANPAWSGEVEIGVDAAASTLHVLADAALGTGRLFVAGRSTIVGASPAVSIGNPVAFAWSESTAGVPVTPVTLSGGLTFTGGIDLGGNVGRVITLADGAAIKFAGPANGGSFRLIASNAAATGGTLTLAATNSFDARIIIGAPQAFLAAGAASLPGGVLKITHPAALGAAGAQIDADGSTIQIDADTAPGIAVLGGGNLFLLGHGASGATLGALHNARGDNSIDGSLALLGDATIRVEAGSRLHVGGNLADQATPGTQPPSAVLTKSGGGTLALLRLARWDLNDGAYAPAAAGALAAVRIDEGAIAIDEHGRPGSVEHVSVVQQISLGASARLDLNRAALLIDYPAGAPSPLPVIRQLVVNARGGGAWSGPGITSTAVAGDPRFDLAALEAADLWGPAGGTYLGRPTDASTIVVAFALGGDADLNGAVNLADFARLGAAFNAPGGWSDGDFNHDQAVGIADFARLASNFNLSVQSLGRSGSTVPEPANLILLAILLGLGRSRRRGI